MQKLHWQPDERPPLAAQGWDQETWAKWFKALRETYSEVPMVVFAGKFGTGKSTIAQHLPYTGVIKEVTRPPCKVDGKEKNDKRHVSMKDWYETRQPRLVTSSVGLCPPYEEWNNWSTYANTAPPTIEEMIGHMRMFLASFNARDFRMAFRRARNRGTAVSIVHSIPHAKNLCTLMGDAPVWVFETLSSPDTIIRRLKDRQKQTGEFDFDDIVLRAKILEALSTSADVTLPPNAIHVQLPNDCPEMLSRNLEVIRTMVGK